MMALVGTLGFNFMVLLPLLARETFNGGPEAYSLLAIAMGVGAVAGSLVTSARGRVGPRMLVWSAFGFGVTGLLAAAAPALSFEAIALIPLGAASVMFAAGVNSTLQIEATPQMRGRVMGLYMIVFMGSTPIGGPLTGYLAGEFGARAGLVMAGISALIAAVVAREAFSRLALRQSAAPEADEFSLPAEAAAALEPATDPGRARACESGESDRAPKTARRRSERRHDPRSPARRSRGDATPAR
jgi:MFS family permease